MRRLNESDYALDTEKIQMANVSKNAKSVLHSCIVNTIPGKKKDQSFEVIFGAPLYSRVIVRES